MEILKITTYAVAALTLLFSIWQYFKNSKRERARWLFELYQKFYEGSEFRLMRLTVEDEKFSVTNLDIDQSTQVDDYFNFFEFVGYLERHNHLQLHEVRAMFEYPLKMIAKKKETLDYLDSYGYEELVRLLKRLKIHET